MRNTKSLNYIFYYLYFQYKYLKNITFKFSYFLIISIKILRLDLFIAYNTPN